MKRILWFLYSLMIGFTLVAGPWPDVAAPIRVGDLVLHLLLVTIFSVLWPITWLSYFIVKVSEIVLW